MKYPDLSEAQFALVVAKSTTGHVLDLNGNISNNEHSEIYHVYNSIDEALAFIRHRIAEDNTLEFCIYDRNQNVIRYLLNDEAKNLLM